MAGVRWRAMPRRDALAFNGGVNAARAPAPRERATRARTSASPQRASGRRAAAPFRFNERRDGDGAGRGDVSGARWRRAPAAQGRLPKLRTEQRRTMCVVWCGANGCDCDAMP
ncbi:Os02g0162550 [Oryza sativa Japonica Group]|uniref:Os02g0162550 protein n=2 Tax=Oryza sativa subsp. japonica TaxID=39947 RepID=Q6H7T0_ORYSJ|nr:hypothetical protein [Oryza sativa Japonica Group]BAS77124.1 Os02g0162550 [Oryza sativa Japonica Group]